MLLLFSLLSACHGVDLLGSISSPQMPYDQGMWESRAMTVEAGLGEAEMLHEQGKRAAAAELVRDVYQGSFEPELEVLVREQRSVTKAAELEYGFGLLEAAMGERDHGRVVALRAALQAQIFEQAQGFDQLALVLR